jgi:hypothetical protein
MTVFCLTKRGVNECNRLITSAQSHASASRLITVLRIAKGNGLWTEAPQELNLKRATWSEPTNMCGIPKMAFHICGMCILAQAGSRGMFYFPTSADMKERGNGLGRIIRPGSSGGVALTGGYVASLPAP